MELADWLGRQMLIKKIIEWGHVYKPGCSARRELERKAAPKSGECGLLGGWEREPPERGQDPKEWQWHGEGTLRRLEWRCGD